VSCNPINSSQTLIIDDGKTCTAVSSTEYTLCHLDDFCQRSTLGKIRDASRNTILAVMDHPSLTISLKLLAERLRDARLQLTYITRAEDEQSRLHTPAPQP